MPIRLLVLCLALGAAGCGEGLVATEVPTAVTGSARIEGTLEAGPNAAAGIRVSALGTGRWTVSGPGGRFVLDTLPGGTVTLRFEGRDVDARLDVALVEGGTVNLVVRLSGDQAVLVAP